jgi:hypothetical protein
MLCDGLADVGTEIQVAIIERDLACIPAFVAALEADPWTFLEAFYLLIGSDAATDELFSIVYDELRFDRFRFTPDVVDDLFANLPAAVASCHDQYRCEDWADWILSRLYVGGMFLCPETAGLGADELILSVPYGGYWCTEALAEALAPLATSDTITDLLDLLVTHTNGWSRRNAARVLGRFAGRSSSDNAGALVLVTRAQDVTNTLLGVLQSDTEEDVLHDVIWVLDSFFYPLWSMLADLQRLSLDSRFSSELRFRAAAAVARLLSAHTGVLPQTDVDYILAALQTDDSWVRAEAAYICETLNSHHLSPSIEAQLIAGLQAARAVENELHAQVYIARALDHFNGNTALFDQLLVDYETSHLANTASGSGILVRSGLPSADLPPFVSLMEDERAAFFDIMGSPFDTLVPGDPNASMTLFLFATMDEYQEYMAAFVGYGSQAGGLYIEAEGGLYTYERTPQQSTLTVEELVQHEFGHYLQARHVFPGLWGDPGYFDEPKAWADEGMAEYLAGLSLDGSGGYTPTLRQVHLSTICSASYRSLDSLLAQRAGYDEAGTFDYANGWAFVYYMISNRMTSVLSLYGAYRDNTYSLSSFATIAGVTSLSVLEADWHGAIAGWCSAPSGAAFVLSSQVGDSARQPTRDAHDAVTRMGARPHLGPPEQQQPDPGLKDPHKVIR